MSVRPRVITSLALFHAFAPIAFLMLSALLQGHTLVQELRLIFSNESTYSLALRFTVLPFAGWALYQMNFMGYFAFLGSVGWVFYERASIWIDYPHPTLLYLSVGALVLDVAISSLIIIPYIRHSDILNEYYWWLAKPRFRIGIAAKVFSGKSKIACTLLDLSEGGARIQFPSNQMLPQKISIEFQLLGVSYDIASEVFPTDTRQHVFRLKFIPQKSTQKRKLKRLARGLSLIGLHPIARTQSPWTEFNTWGRGHLQSYKKNLTRMIAKRDSKKKAA